MAGSPQEDSNSGMHVRFSVQCLRGGNRVTLTKQCFDLLFPQRPVERVLCVQRSVIAVLNNRQVSADPDAANLRLARCTFMRLLASGMAGKFPSFSSLCLSIP